MQIPTCCSFTKLGMQQSKALYAILMSNKREGHSFELFLSLGFALLAILHS